MTRLGPWAWYMLSVRLGLWVLTMLQFVWASSIDSRCWRVWSLLIISISCCWVGGGWFGLCVVDGIG